MCALQANADDADIRHVGMECLRFREIQASDLEGGSPKPKPDYFLNLVLRPGIDRRLRPFENRAAHPFQPSPEGFPRVNVWWLADCALLGLLGIKRCNGNLNAAGLQSKFLKSGSTDCYIAWEDAFVIVAFRGTEPDEWEDILTDAMLRLVPWRTGSVHRGFKQAMDAIWPVLEAELKTLSNGRTVWFCGHSLGAALATLAADRYAKTRGVCTFGCPRVGDRAFAAGFNARLATSSLRYVNNHDIVTHVPPPRFLYKHVDVRRFIDQTDKSPNTAFPTPLLFRAHR